MALKLIRHVREALPEVVGGQLLGLAVGDTLEVSHCFPINQFNPEDDLSEDEQAARNQEDTLTMMKLLRTVNVDSNSVRKERNGLLGPFYSHSSPTFHNSFPFAICPQNWLIHGPYARQCQVSIQGNAYLRRMEVIRFWRALYVPSLEDFQGSFGRISICKIM